MGMARPDAACFQLVVGDVHRQEPIRFPYRLVFLRPDLRLLDVDRLGKYPLDFLLDCTEVRRRRRSEQSVVLWEDRECGLHRKSANVLEVFFVDPAQFEDADPVLRRDPLFGGVEIRPDVVNRNDWAVEFSDMAGKLGARPLDDKIRIERADISGDSIFHRNLLPRVILPSLRRVRIQRDDRIEGAAPER